MSQSRIQLLHQHLIRVAKRFRHKMTQAQGRAERLIRRLERGIKRAILKVRQAPKGIKQAVVIWVAGESITYTTLFVKWMPSTFTNGKIDLFLCTSYHNPMHFKWWLYYLTEEIAKWSVWMGWAKIVVNYSDFAFLICIIFLGMRTIDVGMYLWNFKEYDLIYADIFYTSLTLIWTVFNGYKPEKVAKIKSLF